MGWTTSFIIALFEENRGASHKARIEPPPKGFAYLPHSKTREMGSLLHDSGGGPLLQNTDRIRGTPLYEVLLVKARYYEMEDAWLEKARVQHYAYPNLESLVADVDRFIASKNASAQNGHVASLLAWATREGPGVIVRKAEEKEAKPSQGDLFMPKREGKW